MIGVIRKLEAAPQIGLSLRLKSNFPTKVLVPFIREFPISDKSDLFHYKGLSQERNVYGSFIQSIHSRGCFQIAAFCRPETMG